MELLIFAFFIFPVVLAFYPLYYSMKNGKGMEKLLGSRFAALNLALWLCYNLTAVLLGKISIKLQWKGAMLVASLLAYAAYFATVLVMIRIINPRIKGWFLDKTIESGD
jgi:hypothetical protein